MAATLPPPVPADPTVVARGRIAGGWWRIPLVLLIVVVIFGMTYLLAWLDARNLTTDFMAHASASYEEGSYLEALVGYREYDPELQQNVVYGGYADVVRIWRHQQARPVPDEVGPAQRRRRLRRVSEPLPQRDGVDRTGQRKFGPSAAGITISCALSQGASGCSGPS
jgi:hypothetical protein